MLHAMMWVTYSRLALPDKSPLVTEEGKFPDKKCTPYPRDDRMWRKSAIFSIPIRDFSHKYLAILTAPAYHTSFKQPTQA
jgi:hypothetical protein